MPAIHNIIFDLGNVLLDLEYARARRAFQELAGEAWDFARGAAEAGPIFDLYLKGHVGEAEFFNQLRDQAPRPVEVDDLRRAWNSMLGQLPPHRLEMLAGLRERYRLFLLSNTNYTHVQQFGHLLEEELGLTREEFEAHFEKVYYSCEIGLRKPDVAVYRFVLADAGLDAEDTLLIDDLPANIEGARQVGLQVFQHDPQAEIAEVLPKWLRENRGSSTDR